MARAFNAVLADLSGGRVHESLTDQLSELVTAVLETGKSGKISLEVTVKPNGVGAVLTNAKVKATIPEATAGDTVFFATAGGDLVRNDPRQAEIPLRAVEGSLTRGAAQ